ncbi:bile salt sulfotransferase 1-like [Nannospalax galili]|uniref:bile salt sulfotransferase 1-like n=1 Tax=Nannospalax galili TaxID=1026970 RepID=UPI00111BDADB|nr:bile salt sulfotransferase 1-like [Nannospalax galili]
MSDYMWFEGIPLPLVVCESEVMREIHDKFEVRNEDIVILTYPKSGTNWLSEIVCLIQTKGDPKWIQSMPTWDCLPWIEYIFGYLKLKDQKGPHLIRSHLPIQLFPKSFFSSNAKVIYLIRNPRDVLVSGYFFWSNSNYFKNLEPLEHYFEWFIKGNGERVLNTGTYGTFRFFNCRHGCLYLRPTLNSAGLLPYLNPLDPAQKDFMDSVIPAEAYHDTRGTIQKICQFLGKKLEPEELDSVLKHSSFQAMSENNMSNFKIIPRRTDVSDLLLLRKGKKKYPVPE